MSETTQLHGMLEALRSELARHLVGQSALLDRLLVGLLAGGHLLLEGVPGLAKTLAAKSLALAIGARFQRIQFTADMLPADLVGTEIYQPATGQFSVRQGPVFSEVVLADEINRAPAKVQSALLEAMQERQVTIGETTHALPELFFVLATQNPLEHQGTYPLAEAQLDRFLMKILVDYPTRDEERSIVERLATTAPPPTTRAVVDAASILELRQRVNAVHLESKLADYIVDVVRATRFPEDYGIALGERIERGASPRASIGLALASRALALLEGRDYVLPDDVKRIAPDVLRHRVVPSFEAEAEGIGPGDVIAAVLDGLKVP